MAGRLYSPLESLSVERENAVSVFTADTFAFGTPPPLASSTCPCRDAVTACPRAGDALENTHTSTAKQTDNRNEFIPTPRN